MKSNLPKELKEQIYWRIKDVLNAPTKKRRETRVEVATDLIADIVTSYTQSIERDLLKDLRKKRTMHTHEIGKGSVSSSYIPVTEIDSRLAKLKSKGVV